MADEENAMVSHPVGENETPSDDEDKKPLEDFVTAEYRKQKVYTDALLECYGC